MSAFVAACGPLEPEVVTVDVRAHSIDASERCAVVGDPNLVLHALGPFPVSNLAAEALPYKDDRTLTFPDDTRGLEAVASDGDHEWIGYTERRTERSIDALLWENDGDCDLFRASPMSYPQADSGQALGYSPASGVVLVAGGDKTSDSATGTSAAGSLVFEADTGASTLVNPQQGFREARAFATVTPFGSKLLLAGGEDPLNFDGPAEQRQARQTAFVYDPAARGFETTNIPLELARTRHAAVELANGETLLVGGARPRGDGTSVAVTAFEAVSPKTRRSRIDGLVGLANGRLTPTALRLDNGNVLVGGGYDPAGAPVETVEYFSPDGSSQVSPGATRCGVPFPPCVTLEPRHHRAFVALPGGGALTVGGCAPASNQTPECERTCGAGFGCPTATPDAVWIAADGEPTKLEFEQPLGCDEPFSPERVLLAAGSDGSPWVVAYDEDVEPPCRAVFRFAPWTKPPVLSRVELDLEHWPDPRTPLTSIGPDAFVWLTADDPPLLAGTRQGTRGALSQNEALLGFAPEAPEAPLHLAPDRRPYPSEDRPRALYVQNNGPRLILETTENGYPSVGVFITDARYEDLTISVSFTTTGPPLLLLDAFAVGSEACPWPNDTVSPLVVVRRGNEVTATDGAGNESRCASAPNGAVALGFRAGANSATLTSLSVVRN